MMFRILSVMLAPVRLVLRVLLLTYDRVFTPVAMTRTPEKQAAVDRETSKLALYHFEACPFCMKVRRHIKALGLNIEQRDVRLNKQFNKELVAEGGEFQVPCLRIQKDDGSVQWMYESDDINQYLDERFSS